MFQDKDDFEKLCKILQYKFKNKNLLLQALTRRSALVEKRQSRDIDDFQRLEFLGDKVLNLVISHILMELHPSWREGKLTQETSKYVHNRGPLAAVARRLGLGDFLIMGRGEELNNHARENDKVLSDAMEALLGALWLDSGCDYNLLKSFIIKHWAHLGLIPTVQYEELITIILDFETPKKKRIKQFQEAFDKIVEPNALNNIIEHVIDDAEMLAIVLTKPIEKSRLTEMFVDCVQSGWSTQVGMLLKKGADAKAMCDGETLLQYAVTSNFEEAPQIVELLLQHNADPNWIRCKFKRTYLKSGEISIAQLITQVRDKSSVEKVTQEHEDANTALHRVMLDSDAMNTQQQLQITQSLLRHNANPNLKNEEQKIPLHIICENCYFNETHLEIIRKLIAAKSNVNSKDVHGNTPLHCLLLRYPESCNNPEILDVIGLLLTPDFNIDAQNADGNTVLHLVYLFLSKYRRIAQIVFGGIEIVQLLKEKHPNKQLINAEGVTTEYLKKTILIGEDVLIEIGLPTLVKKLKEEKDEQSNISNMHL